MPVYLYTTLQSAVNNLISGEITSDTDYQTLLNQAVREVLLDIDLRSAKRKASLSPNLFNDIFDYGAPSDLKSNKIIDIKPQVNRGKFDKWTLTVEEEFDRLKKDGSGRDLVCISEAGMTKRLRISHSINDRSVTIDSLDAVGDWTGFGDGENLSVDRVNFVKGSGAISWDIGSGGGTTAGIVNSSLNAFDISEYKTQGSVFVWAYIESTTNITNFIIRIGNDSSNYYYVTITANNEGNAFQDGWNLLRFDFVNKSTVGTPDDDDCCYVNIYMTKSEEKISETDYRFDNIVMKIGAKYDVIYYSKYGWQDSDGVYKENSSAETDYINYDTDEISLIEYKSAELCERYLRNHNEANNYLTLYERKKQKYQEENPSEAMSITTIYHNI